MKKRVFAALCAVVLVLSLTTIALAAGPVVSGGSVIAKPGETVDFAVSISGNPGIAAFKVYLHFDTAKLSVAKDGSGEYSVSRGEVCKTGTLMSNVDGDKGFQALWFDVKNSAADGVLFTVKLTVASDATAGAYPVEISLSAQDTVDADGKEVAIGTANGSVTVKGSEEGGTTAPPPSPSPSPVPSESGYKDVSKGDWYYDAVVYVSEKKLFEGDGGLFSPNAPMTRGMLATVLWRMEGSPASASGHADPFADVAEGEWYHDAVLWASENKIVEGDGGLFSPAAPLSREAMATMLWRYAKYKGAEPESPGAMGMAGYQDVAEISDWAYDAMRWAVLNKLMEGDGGFLTPKAGATRAQVATLLMRALETVGI